MAPRFFVSPASLADGWAHIERDAAHRIARVLRLRQGDRIELCDGSGTVYHVELTEVSPRLTQGRIVAEQIPSVEPAIHLTLYQAVIRERRMAWLLEKATEIGISRFVPLVTERTVRAKNGRVDAPRLRRWQRIVREAAEQSRRTRLPEVTEVMAYADACTQCQGLALICVTGSKARPILDALHKRTLVEVSSIALFVGPEGGFGPSELDLALRRGLQPASLGRRILRSETAGVVGSALVLAALEGSD